MPRLRYPFLLLLLLCARSNFAHEVRPDYFQLTQTAPDTFELLFKVPAMGDRRLSLRPNLPDHCERVAPPVAYSVAAPIRNTRSCAVGPTWTERRSPSMGSPVP
jgi:hypothetical protein